MQEEPWDSYERGRTWSGWSYPLGRTSVEAALREAGVRLLALYFRQPAGRDGGPLTLLRSDCYADIGPRRGTQDRRRNVLTLYAVPSAVRPQAAEALTTGDALREACAWLAAAEAADPTWRDKSHYRSTLLDNGVLRVAELTG